MSVLNSKPTRKPRQCKAVELDPEEINKLIRLRVSQAAVIANVSKATLLRAIHGNLPNAPRLPAVWMGKAPTVKRETLDRWMDALER